jgi:hypothetical protein
MELQRYVKQVFLRLSTSHSFLTGNYSEACSFGILRHVLKYLASYFDAHSDLPCSLLLLQELKPEIAEKLSSKDPTTMRRCGTEDFSKELMDAISDVLFIESPPNEAEARVFERLWQDQPSETYDFERPRALRRLKAELVANDRACRRLWAANKASLDQPPKLFNIGPAVHSTSDERLKSPTTHSHLMMRSPLSSRSHSYDTTSQNRSSASASTTSLVTVDDAIDSSPRNQVHISDTDDVEDIAQRSPAGLRIKLWPSAA